MHFLFLERVESLTLCYVIFYMHIVTVEFVFELSVIQFLLLFSVCNDLTNCSCVSRSEKKQMSNDVEI